MIFGRKKRDKAKPDPEETEEEPVEGEEETGEEEESGELDGRAQARAWDLEFDREEGPFDISEVDLDADDVRRLDFGALVVTPFDGMQLQLQAEREQHRVQSIIVGDGDSALEVAVFAGPSKSSMAEEIRDDILTATEQQNGTLQLAQGPFGTELRRAVPTQDQDGKPAIHVSRTWLVSGPGWVLRGVLLGKAALEPDNEDAQVALFEFFSNLVVRRDNTPSAPGRIIYLEVPEA